MTGDNTVTDIRGMRLKSLENVCFGNIGKTERLHIIPFPEILAP